MESPDAALDPIPAPPARPGAELERPPAAQKDGRPDPRRDRWLGRPRRFVARLLGRDREPEEDPNIYPLF